MGHKIRPTSFRRGVTTNWLSQWFPKKGSFKAILEEDALLRDVIRERIGAAGIDKIIIEKTGTQFRITVKASRPGLIIGRGGKGIEELTKMLEKKLQKLRRENKVKEPVSLNLTIEELKRSEVSANVIAQNIAWDLEKRMPFRRTIKKYLEQIMQHREVQGAKIRVSGRLDGSEIARDESLGRGKLPLATLRADIDYGEATAYTTYGTIGVRVQIYKGEVFDKEGGKKEIKR